jgi:hypothetical protein
MIRYPIRQPFGSTLAWIIGLLTMGVILNGAVDAVAGSSQRVRPGMSVAKRDVVSVVLPDQTFKALLTQIMATDAKMDQAVFYLHAYGNQPYVTNYVTLVDECVALVGTYNSEAHHYSVARFQQVNLPAQIDRLDVTTDCKETPR